MQKRQSVGAGRELAAASEASAAVADELAEEGIEEDEDEFDESPDGGPDGGPDDDAVALDADDALADDDAEDSDDGLNIDLDAMPGQCNDRELSIRRAIEERREARRLRDDLDYLDFDD